MTEGLRSGNSAIGSEMKQIAQSSPILIAKHRIGKILTDLPEEAAPDDGNKPAFASNTVVFGFRRMIGILLCVLAVGLSAGHIIHTTRAFERTITFDPNKVTIVPGLFIRCKLCDTDLYNVADPASACRMGFGSSQFCLGCHGTGGLELAVKCPRCKEAYVPEIKTTRRIVDVGDYSEVQVNCAINAVCPRCGEKFLHNDKISFFDQ